MALKLFGSKNETTPDVAGTESSTIIDIGTPRSAPAAAETEGSLTSRLRRLGIVFAILAATSAGLLVHQGRQAVDATLQVSASSELQTLSQQIAKSAQLAHPGVPKPPVAHKPVHKQHGSHFAGQLVVRSGDRVGPLTPPKGLAPGKYPRCHSHLLPPRAHQIGPTRAWGGVAVGPPSHRKQ